MGGREDILINAKAVERDHPRRAASYALLQDSKAMLSVAINLYT